MKVKFKLDEGTLCKCYYLLQLKALVDPNYTGNDNLDDFLTDYGRYAFVDMLDADIRYFNALLKDHMKGEQNAQKNEA